MNIYYKKEKEKGFSVFFAVIAIGALSLIAYFVSNVGLRETRFSTFNRESQYAFFAADAGIECALYWDGKFNSFDTTTSGSPINCGSTSLITGNTIPGTTTVVTRIGGGGSAHPTSVFGFVLNQGANATEACVIVTVNKSYVGPNVVTHIHSRGYNNCNVSDPRRVERGIEVTY